jgi:hypothetical protein
MPGGVDVRWSGYPGELMSGGGFFRSGSELGPGGFGGAVSRAEEASSSALLPATRALRAISDV